MLVIPHGTAGAWVATFRGLPAVDITYILHFQVLVPSLSTLFCVAGFRFAFSLTE